jgi:hypothetical protein
MNLIEKNMARTLTGLIGASHIEKTVTAEFQKKSKCLANLSNKNKDELKKIDLQMLKGLYYEGHEATLLWKLLKESTDINEKQKEFALFLYNNYPKHSIKAMGFD